MMQSAAACASSSRAASAVASACARQSTSVSCQDELRHVAIEAAIDEGDEVTVRKLMEEALKEDRMCLAEQGDLMLQVCEKGFRSAVELFLSAGHMSVDGRENVVGTPLHVACMHRRADIVKLLLSARATVDAIARHGVTPLITASTHGDCAILRLLLAARATVDLARASVCTPLYVAASRGHADAVSLLLEAHASLDVQARYARPGAGGASKAAGGAPPTASDAPRRLPALVDPLFASCVNGHEDAARVLLEAKASATHVNLGGTTALHGAATKGMPAILRLLLGAQADANALRHDGHTPLSAAAREGHAGCVAMLLGAGARDEAEEEEAEAEATGAARSLRRVSALEAASSVQGATAGHAACLKILEQHRAGTQSAKKAAKEVARKAAEAAEAKALRATKAAEADAAAEALLAEEEREAAERASKTPCATPRLQGKSGKVSRKSRPKARAKAAVAAAAPTAAAPAAAAPAATAPETVESAAASAVAAGTPASSMGSASSHSFASAGALVVVEAAGDADGRRASPGSHASSSPTWLPSATATACVEEGFGCGGGGGGDGGGGGARGGGGGRGVNDDDGGGLGGGLYDMCLCPITQDFMRDPVVTADGQTYERDAIEKWLSRQRTRELPCTSPLTGEPLADTKLVPNVALRGLIQQLLERQPELVVGSSGMGAAFANV